MEKDRRDTPILALYKGGNLPQRAITLSESKKNDALRSGVSSSGSEVRVGGRVGRGEGMGSPASGGYNTGSGQTLQDANTIDSRSAR